MEAFGSTRRKRQLQQRAEGTVVVEGNAAAAELDVMMQEVQRRAQAAGDTREEIMGRLAANRVVPAHNPLATTPEVGGWVGGGGALLVGYQAEEGWGRLCSVPQ